MADTIYETLPYGFAPAEEWVDVGFNITRPTDPLDSLIDDIRTDNIVAKWQSIASEYNTPLMAYYHAYDTEAATTIRVPIDTHNVRKGLIKVKINQSELLDEYVEKGVKEDKFKDYILNDGIRLADEVVTRTKVAKAEMMARGEITIKENNVDIPVVYGVPESHKNFVLDLSPDANISAQLQAIVDQATDEGIALNGFITSRKNLTKMLSNENLQAEIRGTLYIGAQLSQTALRTYFAEAFGFTDIRTHDLNYGINKGLDVNGRPIIEKHRYFPDDVVSFYMTNPAGKVGSGLWGDPPEVRLGGFYPVNASGLAPYVYVTQKAEWDPAVTWTKASALFMPVLFDPNRLWIAHVTDGTSGIGKLTVSSAAGTASGDTTITVNPEKGTGHVYKYRIGGAATTVVYGQSVKTWLTWDGTDEITAATGKTITVVEADGNYKAVASGSVVVKAKS